MVPIKMRLIYSKSLNYTHEDKNFIIGGDFNTALDIHLDKKNGKLDTHKRCRQKITDILETYDLTDI